MFGLDLSPICDLLEGIAGIVPVGGDLSPMVEVTLLESKQEGAQLLHLVNGSGHFGTTFYAPVPMHDVQVSIPCAVAPGSVTNLVSGVAVPFAFAEGTLTIDVPRLELFEALLIA